MFSIHNFSGIIQKIDYDFQTRHCWKVVSELLKSTKANSGQKLKPVNINKSINKYSNYSQILVMSRGVKK